MFPAHTVKLPRFCAHVCNAQFSYTDVAVSEPSPPFRLLNPITEVNIEFPGVPDSNCNGWRWRIDNGDNCVAAEEFDDGFRLPNGIPDIEIEVRVTCKRCLRLHTAIAGHHPTLPPSCQNHEQHFHHHHTAAAAAVITTRCCNCSSTAPTQERSHTAGCSK